MSTDPAPIIESIVEKLSKVGGVEAIVLGGSRARGTHTPDSDVDLGVYYHPTVPLDLVALEQVACEIDDNHRKDLVTKPGGWGPWINGGGWLIVQGQAIDLIYRDLYKVTRFILDALEGRFEMAYQPGHPQGFPSYIYLSEIALCQPLWDPHNTIKRIKFKTKPYPPRMKKAIIDSFWWEADFSLQNAKKSISAGDVAYAAGCCFRSITCLVQTLFAVNEQYWMNEKGSVAIAASFKSTPDKLKEQVTSVFKQLNQTPEGIQGALETLQALLEDSRVLIE